MEKLNKPVNYCKIKPEVKIVDLECDEFVCTAIDNKKCMFYQLPNAKECSCGDSVGRSCFSETAIIDYLITLLKKNDKMG